MKLLMHGNLAFVMMMCGSIIPSAVARLGLEKGSAVGKNLIKSNDRLLADCVNVINGTEGDDLLIGTDCNDLIFGLGGDDTIRGANGDDTLIGGAGNDRLFGGQGKDSIEGGTGDDEVDAGEGKDTAIGEEGDDTLRGGDGSDVLVGGVGDDFISGGRDQDTISGGDGMDELLGGEGDDSIDGGDKADTINAGAGSDAISGGDGDDVLIGGNGPDHITGGAGTNTIKGTSAGDFIEASIGTDIILGKNSSSASDNDMDDNDMDDNDIDDNDINDNDDCVNAIPLVLQDGEVSVSASTSNATFSDNAIRCGGIHPAGTDYLWAQSPGVWYKIIGDGKRIEASTCNAANFNTQLFIYTGSCETPLCVQGNSNRPGCQATGIPYDLTSIAAWISVEGATYYILVTGASWGEENKNNKGDFTLTVSSSDAGPGPKPTNDQCENAVALTFVDNSATVNGTSIGASHDGIPVCYTGGYDSHHYSGNVDRIKLGVWYRFEGLGGYLYLKGATGQRPELYTGGCASLECGPQGDYGYDDEFDSMGRHVGYIYYYRWYTTMGVTYYMRITEFQKDFTLTLWK